MNVALIGATGLVGGYLVQDILASPQVQRLEIFVRRPWTQQNTPDSRLVVRVVEDFQNLSQQPIHCDLALCALGTTIKAVGGSQEKFRQVDLEFPVAFARAAKQGGAKGFALVSALGANSQSRVFYSRTKGQCEEQIQKLGFQHLVIIRPSLLLGARKEFRLGEKVAEFLSRPMGPLMLGPLKKYRPVAANEVAQSLWQQLSSCISKN